MNIDEQESLSMVLETVNEAHMLGVLKSVVVVALNENGQILVGYSVNDPLRVIGLLEAGKQELLLDMMELDEDEE